MCYEIAKGKQMGGVGVSEASLYVNAKNREQ